MVVLLPLLANGGTALMNVPPPPPSPLCSDPQPLRVSGQQARLQRSAVFRGPPLHEHHLGALRPLRHLPDPGHQRVGGGVQHLPHPLGGQQRRLLHQGESRQRARRRVM